MNSNEYRLTTGRKLWGVVILDSHHFSEENCVAHDNFSSERKALEFIEDHQKNDDIDSHYSYQIFEYTAYDVEMKAVKVIPKSKNKS